MRETVCKTCGARIIFAKTPNGGLMPLDADPHPLGNRYLDDQGQTGPVGKNDQPDTRKRYRSHFATCSDPDRHRTKPA